MLDDDNDGESGCRTIVVKDFVTVSKRGIANGRLLVVALLPGQPESGVPKLLLSSEKEARESLDDVCTIVMSYVGSLFCTANLVLLFYFLIYWVKLYSTMFSRLIW